jgi:cellulose synthase/poly-beta-1,6-N-acetylglucosamine synthase-like glycosyltransferase
VLLALALATLAAQIVSAVALARGYRRLRRLADAEPVRAGPGPTVSIVVAARDEARGVGPALASLLAQDHPAVEIVFVDDRSTDATADLAEDVARTDARLQVVRVRELPEGWLGKNHALHAGALRARGEWILFTDADVVLEASAVRRALRLAGEAGLDHLAVGPDLVLPGRALGPLVQCLYYFFARSVRPWRAGDAASRAHVGVGAFNLVGAAAYRAVGGHAPIALRPDDDMKLAKLLKRHGHRAGFAHGGGLVRVAWYASVRELVLGLTKNVFAGLEYRLSLTIAASLATLALDVAPFVVPWFVDPWTRWAYLAAAVASTAGCVVHLRAVGAAPVWAVALLPAALLGNYILWRSTLVTLAQGGIVWRGTRYPLAALRRNRV